MAQASYQSTQRMNSEAANLFAAALKLAEEQKLSSEIILSAKAGLALAMAEQETITNPRYMQELAKSALTLYPAKARLHLALGKAYLAENKPESAELACRQFDRGRIFDRNDVDFTEPYVRAALNTGYPFRFEVAHGAARTAYKIKNSATAELLWARACLETGRIRKGMALINQYFERVPQPTAEAYKIASGLSKQSGDQSAAAAYLSLAKKIDPEIDKHVHLFLTVAPKPSGEDNQGPSKIGK
jgi:tetratricopeptide (TPR) repeat protein